MKLKVWKQWLLDKIDIKPSPPLISTFWKDFWKHYESNNFNESIIILEKIQKIIPDDIEVFKLLISCLILAGNFCRAQTVARAAQQQHPNEAVLEHQLGYVHVQLGQCERAVEHYKKALILDPQAESTRYLLEAAQGNSNIRPPSQYITSLFDSHAQLFEHEMLHTLQYRGHMQLARFLQETLSYPAEDRLQILDLGCGTGLLGRELLKHYPKSQLTGIDLSSAMLSEAREKGGYYAFRHEDMQSYVARQGKNQYDLIAASDAFIYLGDLYQMLQACFYCLRPEGWLGFSVEAQETELYRLQPLGRFQHSKAYIKKLQASIGFRYLHHRAVPFRREKSTEVLSYIFLLQK